MLCLGQNKIWTPESTPKAIPRAPPNGSETLKALPASNAIFDINGTAASTTQSNNTIALYEKVLPTISQTALASDNATITVTFSEAVFDTKTASGTGYVGSGDLEISDFALSVAGGVATLGSATPTSISKVEMPIR